MSGPSLWYGSSSHDKASQGPTAGACEHVRVQGSGEEAPGPKPAAAAAVEVEDVDGPSGPRSAKVDPSELELGGPRGGGDREVRHP